MSTTEHIEVIATFSEITLQPPTGAVDDEEPSCAMHSILSGINFTLRRGCTTAVLGLSGSGKTVLLELVAGRLDLRSFGLSGDVTIGAGVDKLQHRDGAAHGDEAAAAEVAIAALKPRVAFVPANDVVFGFDTPREAITFRHRLAFGSSQQEAEAVAAQLIEDLELTKCADNMIAPGVGLRGISGGQRRRTCIAMALATRPDVLVLDEPTTGLDSTTARHVMASVQEMAVRYQCAVVQSLQQPGHDLFLHFDDLVMLHPHGSLEYSGPTMDAPASVPKPSSRLRESLSIKSPREEKKNNAGADGDEEMTTVLKVEEDVITHPLDPSTSTDSPCSPSGRHRRHGPVATSQSLLFVTGLVVFRHYRGLARNPLALLMRVAQALFLGFFFGVVYFDMEMTTDNLKQVLGFTMVFATAAFMPVQTGAAVFPMEKPVFMEEQRLPFRYPAAVYAFSKFVVETTAQLPLSILYAGIMGGLMGFPSESVGKLMLSSVLLSGAAEGFGFFVSALAPPEVSIAVLTPVVAFIMLVVGSSLAAGANETEDVFNVLKHLAFVRNGFAAVSIDVLGQVKQPCSTMFCLFPNADAALEYYDLKNTSEGREWGLLVMWMVVFRGASMIALTVMAALDILQYDPRCHRRHVQTVSTGDENDRTIFTYEPTPAVRALCWEVNFTVRPRWGAGADVVRTILQPMSGLAARGRTLAIMGGSGAGKTTLLEALSVRLPGTNVFTETRRDTEISLQLASGALVRDVPADARSLVGFVHQDPHFASSLTTRETIAFAATVARREGIPGTVELDVATLLQQLGLDDAAESFVWTLSGSQRKRLAVAVALAQRRPIIMLDEPTSGLDPTSAYQLLHSLQRLARECGVVVLYTLHQPGDDLLPCIDDLLLLSAGCVVYHGPLDTADEAFGNYPRPAGLNATDHYLELSSNATTSAALIASWAARPSSGKQLDAIAPFGTASSAGDELQISARDIIPETVADSATQQGVFAPQDGMGQPMIGFAALVKRSFTVTVLRASLLSLIGRFFALHVLLPGVVGAAMYQQGQTSALTMRNACFAYALGMGYAAIMIPLLDLHLERVTFLREQESGNYSAVGYMLSRTVAALPLDFLGLVCGVNIMYWTVGLTADAGAFFYFLLVAFLMQQTCIGMGLLVGVLIESIVVSAAMGTLLHICFSTVAGVIVDPATMNEGKWMHGLEFASPCRQAVLLLIHNEARFRPDPDLIVERLLGFDRWFDSPQVLWPILLVHLVLWRVLPALCFKFTTRAGSYGRHRGL